jgi:hypothetical protein
MEVEDRSFDFLFVAFGSQTIEVVHMRSLKSIYFDPKALSLSGGHDIDLLYSELEGFTRMSSL